jgi:hypothetical protein
MSREILLADILVTVHLVFVAFVVVGLLLILVGGLAGWSWVRNFWFRSIHLLCIALVAMEGVASFECPLTTWERDMRGGWIENKSQLRNLEGSSWIGATANQILYYDADPDVMVWIRRGHITFGVLVLVTFFLVMPRLPRWKKSPSPSGSPAPASPLP